MSVQNRWQGDVPGQRRDGYAAVTRTRVDLWDFMSGRFRALPEAEDNTDQPERGNRGRGPPPAYDSLSMPGEHGQVPLNGDTRVVEGPQVWMSPLALRQRRGILRLDACRVQSPQFLAAAIG